MDTDQRSRHTILILDDELIIGDMLSLHLAEAGYKTQYVSNGPAFFDIVSSNQNFSLALIDIWMPNMSGLDVLERLRATGDLPVIMMAGHGSENLAVNSMKRGASDYVVKPIDLTDILQRVDDVIIHSITQCHELAIRENDKRILNRIKEEFRNFQKDIDHIKNRSDASKLYKDNTISKSIEFDEDTYQAGVSILSYFSTVINQKYPNNNVKIRIEQEARKVRLIIETPDGEKEEIERTLEEYGLVVVGGMQPAELLSNELHVLQLRHKLDMAVMELSYTRELGNAERASHSREIEGLKEEVSHLRVQISEAFKRENQAHNILVNIIETHKLDGPARDAVAKLSEYFSGKIVEKDKEIILELIGIVKKQNTSAYDDIKSYALATFSGASGGLLGTWVNALFVSISKM